MRFTLFVIFFMYACFALIFPIGKNILEVADPLFVIAVRMTLASFILMGYMAYKDSKQLCLSKTAFFHVFLAGFFNIFICNYLEFISLKFLSASKTCFIYNLSPFLSAIISYFILKETLNKKKCLGLLIGFIGMLPILISETPGEAGLDHLGFLSQAEITMLLAVVATVLGWIIMRKLITVDKVSPLSATAWSQLIGGLLSFVASYATEEWDPIPVRDYSSFIQLSVVMLIVSNLIAYNLYGHLLKTYTAPFVSFCGFSTPFFAALFAYFIRGEHIDIYFIISSVIVFAGLWLFYQQELKSGVRHH